MPYYDNGYGRRSSRRTRDESPHIFPDGYESPPPHYAETPSSRAPRGRHDDRSSRAYYDDTRSGGGGGGRHDDRDRYYGGGGGGGGGGHRRHHSVDAQPSRGRSTRQQRYDSPSDSEDSEDEYRRRRQQRRDRGGGGDRDRDRDGRGDSSKYYPPRAGGRRDNYYPPQAGNRGAAGHASSSSRTRTDSRGEPAPAGPQRSRSWSDAFKSPAAKDKMMAAGSAALAAGAAEVWKVRKDRSKMMEKGIKIGTAAAGAAAVAAFQNKASGGGGGDGREDDGRRRRDSSRYDDRRGGGGRYDDRYDDRRDDRQDEGGGKRDTIKAALGGMVMNRLVSGMMKR